MTAVGARLDRAGSPAIDGVREMLPAAIGVLPFATMIGVAIGASPMSQIGAWISGLVVAGGSAHLAITASVTAGASFVATVVTALLINSRTLIYGALMAPMLRSQPRWFRWVAAYALVDQVYALTSGISHRGDEYVRRYYLASTSLLWATYMTGVAVGIVMGPVVPSSIPLGLAVPIMFLAMVLPSVRDRASRVAGLVGMTVAVLAVSLPSGMGMIVAIISGTAAGALADGGSDA
jgi:predicted branched-subunit amino acid permease